MDAIIARTAAAEGRPAITYRHAGDSFVLAEYGDMVLDLRLNFYAIAVKALLDASGIRGVTESAPGYRSLMVGIDSAVLSPSAAVEALADLHAAIARFHRGQFFVGSFVPLKPRHPRSTLTRVGMAPQRDRKSVV